MKRNHLVAALCGWFALAGMSGPVWAQAVQPAEPSAGVLAKYDQNKNGRLDPDELAAMESDQDKAAKSTVVASGSASGDSVVQLSPFEVISDNTGYYAANTMAGTRLNSKLEDLASSITVVTKEQMTDFAMLDINDIFAHEAGVEGSGTFTNDLIDRNGSPYDRLQQDPSNSNRMGGIGPASISMSNFETSGRVPVDPINIDAVEISRGPNSNIFGIGDAAGTVNMVGSTANTTRNRTQVGLRADSYDGYRGSIDMNRVLLKSKLAIRGSAVFQHDGYVRKPSGTDTKRYNGMVKYQPFKSTTVTANYSYYNLSGNRANTALPSDGVTNWKERGSPTYDPITAQVKINGAVVGAFPTSATLSQYGFTSGPRGNLGAQPSFLIGSDGLFLMQSRLGTTDLPTSAAGNIRFMETTPPIRSNQPLYARDPVVTDKSMYDYSSVNTAAVNFASDKTETYTVSLEQTFFSTERQLLAAQAAWFREDSERKTHYPIGTGADGGRFGYLSVDVNERLLDGRPNPYFLRPFMGTLDARDTDSPFKRDTYRGQLAYRLDFTQEKNLLRWLGRHQLSGYAEYRKTIQRSGSNSYRTGIVDNHAWLAPGSTRGSSGGVKQPYYKYYLGDNVRQNIDYAPTQFQRGVSYPFYWYDAIANRWVTEPVTLGLGGATDTSQGQSLNISKTRGGVLQSYFLKGRIVTTFGLRQDQVYGRRGGPAVLLPDGQNFNFELMDQLSKSGPYDFNQGRTKTSGVVVKPFRWLSFHVNKSDNFQPVNAQTNLFLEPTPNPSGRGKDYGFSLNLFDGKLNIRANQSTVLRLFTSGGDTSNIATRLWNIEFDRTNMAWNLERQARLWLDEGRAAQGLLPLTAEEFAPLLSKISGLPVDWYQRWQASNVRETNDLKAQNRTVEINYNPTRFWTMKANVTETESVNTRVSDAAERWVAYRMPAWTSIIDPRDGRPWYTNTTYPGGAPSAYVLGFVTTPMKIAQGLVGKSNPQIRKYRANFSTNFRLAGITEHRVLKRFNVGGSLRWEDKAAIGFRGIEELPAIVTALDPNKPIFDKPHYYVDLLAGYRTRIWSEKYALTLQFNVRNLQESKARLQAIRVFPDGSPNTYRIVDPRQFIFTATLEL